MAKQGSKELWLDIEQGIETEPYLLGRYTSQAYRDDPCSLAFITSRYKFCSKILAGPRTVLEVGCGDGFGGALVAQRVDRLICTDINQPVLEDNRQRMSGFSNIEYHYHDFSTGPYAERVDGIYLVDVIEHIWEEEEGTFLANLCGSLNPHGICLIGTPNRTAEQYASKWSRAAHVNLKDHAGLDQMGRERFHNHFTFGMNDEVVHTGFSAMAHFQWLLGVGPR